MSINFSFMGQVSCKALITVITLGKNLKRIRRVPQFATEVRVRHGVGDYSMCSSQGGITNADFII